MVYSLQKDTFGYQIKVVLIFCTLCAVYTWNQHVTWWNIVVLGRLLCSISSGRKLRVPKEFRILFPSFPSKFWPCSLAPKAFHTSNFCQVSRSPKRKPIHKDHRKNYVCLSLQHFVPVIHKTVSYYPFSFVPLFRLKSRPGRP